MVCYAGRVRWDSPFVLAAAGTIAIHVLLITAGDAVTVLNPYRAAPPAPHVEIVEVEIPPVIQPEPVKPAVQPEVRTEPVVQKTVDRTPVRAIRATTPPPPVPDQPPETTATQPSGGDQVVTLDEAPPGATGVGVAIGKRTSQHVGRGGTGTGTGAGSGAGAATEVAAAPVSVATIKKRAMPRGDYGYFEAGKDYPTEARQLGIEGAIRVRLIVDGGGKVTSSVLLNKLGHGLDELALERARKIEFDPARDTDDHPVTSVVVWTFNMTLPK